MRDAEDADRNEPGAIFSPATQRARQSAPECLTYSNIFSSRMTFRHRSRTSSGIRRSHSSVTAEFRDTAIYLN